MKLKKSFKEEKFMAKSKNTTWKRVASGAMSATLAAAPVIAQNQGIIKDTTSLVALASNPIELTATNTTVTPSSTTYTGSDIGFVVSSDGTPLTADQYSVTIKKGDVAVDSIKDAGDYTVTITAAEESGYTGSVAKTVTIGKKTPTLADITITFPDSFVYDGTVKNCAVAAKEGITGMGDVTLKYFSAAAPTTEIASADVKNAGTYLISVIVAAGTNYKALSFSPNTVKLNISKANIPSDDFTAPTANNFTYDGTNKPLVNAGSVADNVGTVQYALGENAADAPEEGWSENIPTKKAAGNYFVWFRVLGDENHNDILPPVCVPVSVAKKTIGITWGDSAFNYTGEEQAPTATATGLIEGDTCVITVSGAKAEAGTYEATASELSNSNYKLPADAKKAFTINPNIVFYEDSEIEKTTVSRIKSISYGETTITENIPAELSLPAGTEITIVASGALEFPELLEVDGNWNSKEYTYKFTITDEISEFKIGHEYDYKLKTDDEHLDSIYGFDRNDREHKNNEWLHLASIVAEDLEYLSYSPDDYDFQNVEIQKFNNFALNPDSEYRIDTVSENASLVNDKKPVSVGEYSVKAGVRLGEASYWMTDNFKVNPRAYASHTEEISVSLENSNFTYNKKAQKPTIIVKDTSEKLASDKQTLVLGKDYELGYLNKDGKFVSFTAKNAEKKIEQTNAGTYKVYVNFIGNYSGLTSIDWTIKQQTLKDMVISPDNDLAYNGAGHAATVAAADKSELPEAADDLFAIAYVATDSLNVIMSSAHGDTSVLLADKYLTAPKDAGNYTAILIVKDKNYKLNNENGYQTKEFTVIPKAITVTPAAASKTFGAKEPDGFTCTTKDELANSENQDFSKYITRAEGENAGKYDFIISGADETGALVVGNYKISLAKSDNKFTINRKEIKPTVSVAAVEGGYFYTGSAITPEVIVKNGENSVAASEYTVTFDKNVNAGTATVTVSDKEGGNYKISKNTAEFVIQPKSIADVSVAVEDKDCVADGETKFEPAVTVTDPAITVDGKAKVLKAGTDYTVAFEKNINAGTATAKITGKGNYSDTTFTSADFTIKSTFDISSVKDKITKIEYDGNEIVLAEGEKYADKYTFEVGKEIKISATETLAIGTPLTSSNEDKNGYYYTFTIPANTNIVTATHTHDYDIQTDGNKAYGIDRDIIGATKQLLATLVDAEHIYYLDDVESKLSIKVEEDAGITIDNVVYTFENKDGTKLVGGKPVNKGEYVVSAKTPINGSNYYLKKVFEIEARKYDGKEVAVEVKNAQNAYTGKAVIPQIVVTDSKRAEGEQVLVRGKDYQIGYYKDEQFVVVTADKDADYFKDYVAGEYSVDVRFIGNYSGETTAVWNIGQEVLPALTVAPDDDLVYNTKGHPVKVTAADPEAEVPTGLFKIKYGDADSTIDSTDLTEEAPVNAGSYKAFIILENTKNYAFAENQKTVVEFTISPKSISSEDIKVEYPAETFLNPTGWTYCEGITVTDTVAKNTLEAGKEGEEGDYFVERNRTTIAGNIKVLICGMGNYTDSIYIDWSVIDESAIDEEAAQNVDSLIEAIGEVEYSDSCKKNIDAAFEAYTELTEAQRALVKNAEVLESAENTYNTLSDVAKAIDAIGKVELTEDSKKLIDDARTAYDALDEALQSQIKSYPVLTSAEDTYASLEAVKKAEADLETANNNVAELTKQLADAETAIDEEAQKQIDDLKKQLADAETAAKEASEKLEQAQADKTAAESAQAIAEATAKQALADKATAEATAKQAVADKAAAEAAEKTAEEAKDAAEKSAKEAAQKAADAEAAKKAAEEALAKALESEEDASEVVAAAEAAKKAAEEAAKKAEADKATAEAAQKAAEKAQATAEATAKQALADKETAEETAKQALADKAAAEAAQKAAEEAQAKAEEEAAAKKTAADKAAANNVIAKIKAIGKVQKNNTCENAIIAARAAYDTLTSDQKALVTNYADLTKAESTYKTLPQTGMSGVHKAFAGIAALMGITGLGLVKKSRKEDEEE
jgi:LPXTG-motif cell wall-anchored protein